MQTVVAASNWPDRLTVRVLQSGQNGGFGAGNNFGIRAGRSICPNAEFVYILNPDAQVEDTSIAALVDHLNANPKAAIAIIITSKTAVKMELVKEPSCDPISSDTSEVISLRNSPPILATYSPVCA